MAQERRPELYWTSAGSEGSLRPRRPSCRTWARRLHPCIVNAFLLAVAALWPWGGLPQARADPGPYYLRNHSPFLQIFGLPAPEGGVLAPAGALATRLGFTLANHADKSDTSRESIVLDGESYYTNLTLRYGVADRWELGVDIPYVSHDNGRLDNLIEGWHDLFGLTNGQRHGPSNHLQVTYVRDGIVRTELGSDGGGIGDIRLTGAYRLHATPDGRRSVAARGLVKVPTGDEHRLRGSGATDLAVSLDVTDRALLGRWSTDVFLQAGVLFLGQGEVLDDQQKHTVPFASTGLAWHWRRNVDLRLQLAIQGEYFDSSLAELGAGTANVAVGGSVHFQRLGLQLDVALVEDLISDATPDFGLHLAVTSIPRRASR